MASNSPMRRFLASAWFPLLACLLLAGAQTLAFFLLSPDGSDVGNGEIVRVFGIAGWAVGAAAALLSFLLICILNGIRRLVKLRKAAVLHPLIVLLGILPWLLFGVQMVAYEPRFTPFARAFIAYVGAPMLWGALAASAFAILGFLLLLVPAKKA